jgi:hypothetical protein
MKTATELAQQIADQELDACCKWLPKMPPWSGDDLQRHRRPKPPSLKEQALEALKDLGKELPIKFTDQYGTVLRALEQLDD